MSFSIKKQFQVKFNYKLANHLLVCSFVFQVTAQSKIPLITDKWQF